MWFLHELILFKILRFGGLGQDLFGDDVSAEILIKLGNESLENIRKKHLEQRPWVGNTHTCLILWITNLLSMQLIELYMPGNKDAI